MDMNAGLNSFQLPGTGPKQTCQQCRVRKVRCDGNMTGCRTCFRLKFRCSYLSPTPTAPLTSAPNISKQTAPVERPQRRRIRRACIGCRDQKICCSGQSPRCSHCVRRDIRCVYPTTKERHLPNPVDSSHSSEINKTLTPTEDCRDVEIERGPSRLVLAFPSLPKDLTHQVNTFLSRFYPLPSYSFFHPATMRKRCMDETLEESLVLSICALVALSANPGSHDATSSAQWIHTAEQLIWEKLERHTIQRLQALLLIILYRMETGRFQRAFMLVATAARMAAAMRLNHEHPELNEVAREVRRRVIWSLKLVERYFSIGLSEFEVCPFETIYVELPSREDRFNMSNHQRAALPYEMTELGVYKLCMRLESIRRDIMKLSRSIALCDDSFLLLPKLINDFEGELSAIREQMPKCLDSSSSVTAELADNTWLPRYMLLYLSWHQCHCDLYRLLLKGYQEAAPSVVLYGIDSSYLANAEKECLQHAIIIIRIMTSLNEHSTKTCLLEFDTAICVYHAIRLVFFITSNGRGPSIPSSEFVISRAALCLAALRRFFPSSVLVKPIVEEIERCLRIFSGGGQQAAAASSDCLTSLSTDARKDQADQISDIAKARERLAIHSLLLQVECSDDDSDDEYDKKLSTDSGGRGYGWGLRSVDRAIPLQPLAGVTSTGGIPSMPSASDLTHDVLRAGGGSLSSSSYSQTYSPPMLPNQMSPDPKFTWDINSYPTELASDLQFPLFPWWNIHERDDVT